MIIRILFTSTLDRVAGSEARELRNCYFSIYNIIGEHHGRSADCSKVVRATLRCLLSLAERLERAGVRPLDDHIAANESQNGSKYISPKRGSFFAPPASLIGAGKRRGQACAAERHGYAGNYRECRSSKQAPAPAPVPPSYAHLPNLHFGRLLPKIFAL